MCLPTQVNDNKVKLSLDLIKHHITEMYGREEVWHPTLPSVLDADEWSVLQSGCFAPMERTMVSTEQWQEDVWLQQPAWTSGERLLPLPWNEPQSSSHYMYWQSYSTLQHRLSNQASSRSNHCQSKLANYLIHMPKASCAQAYIYFHNSLFTSFKMHFTNWCSFSKQMTRETHVIPHGVRQQTLRWISTGKLVRFLKALGFLCFPIITCLSSCVFQTCAHKRIVMWTLFTLKPSDGCSSPPDNSSYVSNDTNPKSEPCPIFEMVTNPHHVLPLTAQEYCYNAVLLCHNVNSRL